MRISKIFNFAFLILHFTRKGFTLLEIIIAIAITSAVILTVIHTINYHSEVLYEHTLATKMFFLAKEKLYELEQNPQNAEGTISGTDFKFKNTVNKNENEDVIELKTAINSHGKEVVLSELVLNKQIQNLK